MSSGLVGRLLGGAELVEMSGGTKAWGDPGERVGLGCGSGLWTGVK